MAQKSHFYISIRKEKGLSREKASALMKTISPEKLEKIENGKQEPTPADILEMAEGYTEPMIRNYYCAHECPMGRFFVPEIHIGELEKIVLRMLSSLNSMHSMQERLINISADGRVDDTEIRDFIRIQKELERISMAASSMQLWSEKMLSEGVIDMEKYNEISAEFEE